MLDWELSTLGHPLADLAYQCMQWQLNGRYRGLGGVDRAANGIPTEAEYVAAYCKRMGFEAIPDWTFLVAFSFFRSIAIHQGVYKRSLNGNASESRVSPASRRVRAVCGAYRLGRSRSRCLSLILRLVTFPLSASLLAVDARSW